MSDGEYRGLYWNWIEEWSQFFQPCNWYTFHPIMIELEDERNMGGVELTLIVLGLGFRIRWNHTETEMVEKIKSDIDALDLGTN